MSGATDPRPTLGRIEREADEADRLALAREDQPDALAVRRGPGRIARMRGPLPLLAGFGVLALGFSVAGAVSVVDSAFRWSPALGAVASVAAVSGFGLVLLGLALELRGLARLRGVDRIRRDLASRDPVRAVAAARRWLALIEGGDALRPALDALNDPDAVLPLLRNTVASDLRARSDALARRAAVEVVAGIAAMPAPALVVPLVAWRGIRLIREIASLHGLRPGLAGTLGLLRRTLGAATATALTEAAINTAAHAALSTPLLAHLAGEMAGGAVAARRMIVLGRAASAACTPLPMPE